MNELDLKQIARECYHNPVNFCTKFFPHIFTESIPWMHRGLLYLLLETFDLLEQDEEADKIKSNFLWESGESCFASSLKQNTLIMLPGGYGKTTFAGLVLPLRELIYRNAKFILYVAASTGDGKNQIINLRSEIENNNKIKAVFGNLKGIRWNGSFMELASGCAATSRGYGLNDAIEKVKGIIWSGAKPDLILIDGISTRSNMSSGKQREELRRWFFSDVVPALAPRGRMIMLDTLRHEDALSEHLIHDQSWNVLRLSAVDKEGAVTWAYMADEAKLEERRRSYALGNQLHIFRMEYYNEPQGEESTGLIDEIDNERDAFIAELAPFAEETELAMLEQLKEEASHAAASS